MHGNKVITNINDISMGLKTICSYNQNIKTIFPNLYFYLNRLWKSAVIKQHAETVEADLTNKALKRRRLALDVNTCNVEAVPTYALYITQKNKWIFTLPTYEIHTKVCEILWQISTDHRKRSVFARKNSNKVTYYHI